MLKTVCFTELTPAALKQLKAFLENGETVAFPTETVYGLGSLLSSSRGLEKLYRLKKRARSKALTVHLGRVEDAALVAEAIPDEFYLLARHFLPGPLTLVLKKKASLPALVSPYPTVGVRVPSHPFFLKLAGFLAAPLVGTSANLSSLPPLTSASKVREAFQGQIAALIDGGEALLQKPSTIVSLAEEKPMLLREGSLKKETIEAVLKKPLLCL
ncbi:MAG: L-threonylcarbamoyladenylate synthase [Parachlamydiales bacterium]|jgi:L-threonylcarbamoyladenylate synthase